MLGLLLFSSGLFHAAFASKNEVGTVIGGHGGMAGKFIGGAVLALLDKDGSGDLVEDGNAVRAVRSHGGRRRRDGAAESGSGSEPRRPAAAAVLKKSPAGFLGPIRRHCDRSFLPATGGAFGERGVHLGIIGVLAKTGVHFLLQFLRRAHVVTIIGVEENEASAGGLEAQKQGAFAQVTADDLAGGEDVLGFQMRGVEAEVHLFGIFFWGVLQGHDFLRKDLGFVLTGVDLAGDENRAVDLEKGRNLS